MSEFYNIQTIVFDNHSDNTYTKTQIDNRKTLYKIVT